MLVRLRCDAIGRQRKRVEVRQTLTKGEVVASIPALGVEEHRSGWAEVEAVEVEAMEEVAKVKYCRRRS